jgi:CBS domain containing-hemolysin-like protein
VTTILLQIALLGVLLVFSGFFSGSETALFSLKPFEIRKLERRPSRRSIGVASLLSDPLRLLVTILVGNTLVNVAASSVGTNIVGHVVQRGVVGISVAVMSALILIFGEIVPKTYAVNKPLKTALRTSGLIAVAVKVMSPLRAFFRALSSLAAKAKLPGAAMPDHEHAHVVEAVVAGHSEGVLDGLERRMLGGFLKIEHQSVQNIMTPRTEVFMLDAGTRVADAVGPIKSAGFSRVPVFETENRDNIKGVVYVKDLLQKQYSENLSLSDIARRPVYVPESKSLVDLLSEFVKGAAHFSVVVDEYGSYSGIVTLDDIIEEIVGEELNVRSKNTYRKRTRSTYEVSARMELEYFNALLGSLLVDSNAETVGGFILNRTGRIPAVGEEFTFEGIRFKILDGDLRQIGRLEVGKK